MGGVLYLYCQDADPAAEDWSRLGSKVNGPRDEDYGKREGSVTDPDGNVIRFGSPIRSTTAGCLWRNGSPPYIAGAETHGTGGGWAPCRGSV